ncbi:MAG: Ferrous iron transport protein B [Tenericutes bacterium ADurb.Bin087]|nr:MAG: Ferrous iron transport protein B [Tenericutes bacterium ADurb.Bin087]
MKIALIGNQNSGKTSLFNLLTGNNQKVGNWPGVTLERKTGILRTSTAEVIDLPGIYSLSPYSNEENIVRRFLLEEKVDLIINIIDSTALERSLYLTTQLYSFNIPMIIALNMTDLAFEQGLRIDVERLSTMLNVPIIPISCLKRTGIKELIMLITKDTPTITNFPSLYSQPLQETIRKVAELLPIDAKEFLAIKLLEADVELSTKVDLDVNESISQLKAHYKLGVSEILANERYNFIEKIRDEAVSSREKPKLLTDKIDRILLNKYLAIPIFVLIMLLVYFLAAGPVGMFLSSLVERGFAALNDALANFLVNVGASPWAVSLVVDGILTGVTSILSFVPQLLILFFMTDILEASGYMSRIAFFFDRIFRKVGLSGKALIPFIIGTGCSVPAIMASRVIEDERERKLTVLLTPFIPCGAKLPIITLFAAYFFPDTTGLVSASLYFLAIIIILLTAFVLKRVFYKQKYSPFIQELPTYKAPNMRYVLRDTGHKTWSFITNAGSVILFASVILWFLLSFNWKLQYGVAVDKSILSDVGRLFSFIFYPFLGTNSWAAAVSIIQGLVAKEQVVSSLSIIAKLSGGDSIFNSPLFAFFTPASAYAFMAFNLFSAPCFGAIGAMYQEFGNRRTMIKALLLQTIAALLIATLIFQLGTLVEGLL